MGVSKNKTINTILVFLIILSFFLSFALWTTGRNIGEEESLSGSGSSSTISLITHSMEDAFRPQTVALHGLTEEEPLLTANSYDLRDLFKENKDKQKLSRVERIDSLTTTEYLTRIQSGQWLEFIYPAEIPFGIISERFLEMDEDQSNLFFDRVLINLNTPDRVYFYHAESKKMYDALILENEEINLDFFLTKDNLSYHAAEVVRFQNQIRYLPAESIEIYYRTYVIHQLPNSSYISNFFTDTSLVDVRSSSDNVRYIDLTKEVTINDKNHTLTYLSQIYTADEMSSEEKYMKSFQQINQFENWADTFILSSYDEESDILSFRREIDGVPVFSKDELESILEVAIVEEGLTHLKLPLRFANTPINIKGAPTKVLGAATNIIEELRKKLVDDDFEKIADFTLGYSWEESDEESQVINFNPNWYVLYDNNWITASSLLELNKETVYGF